MPMMKTVSRSTAQVNEHLPSVKSDDQSSDNVVFLNKDILSFLKFGNVLQTLPPCFVLRSMNVQLCPSLVSGPGCLHPSSIISMFPNIMNADAINQFISQFPMAYICVVPITNKTNEKTEEPIISKLEKDIANAVEILRPLNRLITPMMNERMSTVSEAEQVIESKETVVATSPVEASTVQAITEELSSTNEIASETDPNVTHAIFTKEISTQHFMMDELVQQAGQHNGTVNIHLHAHGNVTVILNVANKDIEKTVHHYHNLSPQQEQPKIAAQPKEAEQAPLQEKEQEVKSEADVKSETPVAETPVAQRENADVDPAPVVAVISQPVVPALYESDWPVLVNEANHVLITPRSLESMLAPSAMEDEEPVPVMMEKPRQPLKKESPRMLNEETPRQPLKEENRSPFNQNTLRSYKEETPRSYKEETPVPMKEATPSPFNQNSPVQAMKEDAAWNEPRMMPNGALQFRKNRVVHQFKSDYDDVMAQGVVKPLSPHMIPI